MGIEYTLVNHKDKTCFELGKGSWYALCDHKGQGDICLLYENKIYDTIINEIWETYIRHSNNSENYHKVARELAKNLFNFINNADPTQISLANDCDDSKFKLREDSYCWIRSRDSGANFYELNEHLKTNFSSREDFEKAIRLKAFW
jgi:hypothetical protein